MSTSPSPSPFTMTFWRQQSWRLPAYGATAEQCLPWDRARHRPCRRASRWQAAETAFDELRRSCTRPAVTTGAGNVAGSGACRESQDMEIILSPSTSGRCERPRRLHCLPGTDDAFGASEPVWKSTYMRISMESMRAISVPMSRQGIYQQQIRTFRAMFSLTPWGNCPMVIPSRLGEKSAQLGENRCESTLKRSRL